MSPNAHLFCIMLCASLSVSAFAKNSSLQKLDTQDVSYLWPEYNEHQMLSAVGKNPSEDLLPSREVYEKLQRFLDASNEIKVKNRLTGLDESVSLHTDTVTTTPLSDYRVVSFRVDNCGPFAGHIHSDTQTWFETKNSKSLEQGKAQCTPQLRLVLQPVMHWEDVALHFVYNFKNKDGSARKDVLKAMATELIRLKHINPIKTTGLPLGPQEGLKDSKFNSEVLKFLKRFARPGDLHEIAVLSTNAFDGNNEWVFVSMDIDPSHPDQLVFNPHLSLKGSPLSQSFESKSSHDLFERPSLGIDNPENAKLETAVSLMNPELTSNKSVDCLSCHSETRTMIFKALHNKEEWDKFSDMRVSLKTFKGISALPDPRFLPTDVDGVEGNFRQFGYFNSQPVVTFRTALESAHVAAALNELLSEETSQVSSDSGNFLEKIKKTIEESLSSKK